ncbi:M23 family metallopeptidase [Paraflavitalea sp. CAU 1676]|uniref:M23 family metallopeptidase n=1 Tax=Paraflavitalea sp. CAU 1676 TaxID=3032598 RepID=UPI0023DB0FC9|nr:M23 family metallopeptidase [Paraflavitalea sp. CAU 1676]MDF2187906.1 M23 family metallopeptidase [Paraflavitalea sp. CAU 1676]
MNRSYFILLSFFILSLAKYSFGQQTITPGSLQIQLLQKPIPVTIDHKPTLVYEMHFTNTSSLNLEITGFSILNLANKDTLLNYDQTALNSRLQPIATRNNPGKGAIIQPAATHILYIEANTSRRKFPAIFHHVRFKAAGDSIHHLERNHDTLTLSSTQPTIFANPLKGGNWTAVYDPSWQRGHRRVVYEVKGRQRIPGRFAIDFIKIDSAHYAEGNEDSIQNWLGYAEEVLAVADGEVASVRDDFPESATLAAHPVYRSEQATGNYISLKLTTNRYVFYEHLKPGSIKVKPGQKIKKGEVIALLGFTGQTTGPHLHLHLADSNSPLGAEGLPFIFETFTLIGRYPDFSKFGKATFNKVRPEKIRHEMPPSNTVVIFE